MTTDSSEDSISPMEAFYQSFMPISIKRGTHLFVQDEIPRYGYAIRSGTIRAFTYTENMDEKSTSFVVKHEVFPIGWIFNKSSTAFFNYVAHTDCEVYRFDKVKFHAKLGDNPDVASMMLHHSINDYMAKVMQISALEQPRADLKILNMFKYFGLRHGKRILRDKIRITIPLTQKDIASFTGLTRETVTNEVIKLKKTKLLSVRHQLYTIDVKLLERSTGDSRLDTISISG